MARGTADTSLVKQGFSKVAYTPDTIEEFKNCLLTDIKTYIDEQKVESLHQAEVLADDYALTHKSLLVR